MPGKISRVFVSLCCSWLLASASAAPLPEDKQLYGLHEHVHLKELGLTLKAKLDTGATTSSLSAKNIEHFKRGGEPWVRFELAHKSATQRKFELPLSRVSRIKRRVDDFDPAEEKAYSTRPVVLVTVQLGERQQAIEVNLTDRSAFIYPFLLGNRGLKALGAVVDPSQRLTAGQPKSASVPALSSVHTVQPD